MFAKSRAQRLVSYCAPVNLSLKHSQLLRETGLTLSGDYTGLRLCFALGSLSRAYFSSVRSGWMLYLGRRLLLLFDRAELREQGEKISQIPGLRDLSVAEPIKADSTD